MSAPSEKDDLVHCRIVVYSLLKLDKCALHDFSTSFALINEGMRGTSRWMKNNIEQILSSLIPGCTQPGHLVQAEAV